MMLKILVGSTLGLGGRAAKFVKIVARFQIAMDAELLPTSGSTYLALTSKNSDALATFPSDNSCKTALAKNKGFSVAYQKFLRINSMHFKIIFIAAAICCSALAQDRLLSILYFDSRF